jgi:4'-phosphopantetheinyl transferase
VNVSHSGHDRSGSGTLSPEAVHVWLCDLDSLQDSPLLERYRAMLDEQEILRLRRFAFARDRHRFLVSHALLRSVLSHYGGLEPASWRFATGAHGKPAVVAAQRGAAPEFNLSHSGSLAVLAVAAQADSLGVDLEQHRPGRNFLGLARRNFAPAEAATLPGLAGEELAGEFYDLWTLKEAFVKARGDGLSRSLAEFWFSFDRGRNFLSFDAAPALEPEPARWRFWSYRLRGSCSAALALRVKDGTRHDEPQWFAAVPESSREALSVSCTLGSRRITAN